MPKPEPASRPAPIFVDVLLRVGRDPLSGPRRPRTTVTAAACSLCGALVGDADLHAAACPVVMKG